MNKMVCQPWSCSISKGPWSRRSLGGCGKQIGPSPVAADARFRRVRADRTAALFRRSLRRMAVISFLMRMLKSNLQVDGLETQLQDTGTLGDGNVGATIDDEVGSRGS